MPSGKNVKLLSTRGLTAIMLTLALIYLFITNTDTHITEYITVYGIVLHYMFDSGGSDKD